MADDPVKPAPEAPRYEPEILPPSRAGAPLGESGPGAGDGARSGYAFRRIEIRRISPLRLFIWAVIALSVVTLIAGTMLLALPIIAGLAALSFLAAWLRRVLKR